jgi:imidazole glycerol-phosphate synthase subunit HisH
MMTIVDYGLGNVLALATVYKKLNIPAVLAREAAQLQAASKIILPGVGAFDHAIELLDASGMREALDGKVRGGTPVLGICVGMQMLGVASDEGRLPGLGWVDGRVRRFAARSGYPLPHMGWNDVRPTRANGLFTGLERDARFYFLHSYYFECARGEDALAVADYGGEFSCAVNAGTVYGVQFHPEKSHHFGTQVLKNFAEL